MREIRLKTKVTARGQVSIPSDIRKRFNIEPDSKIEWVIDNNIIRLIPLPKDTIAAFRGRGKKKYTNKQLIKDRRAERKRENEKTR